MPDEIEIAALKRHEACESSRLQILLKQLAVESIRESIHVDSNTGFILDGAHRSQVCQTLGMQKIPVHFLSIQADASVPGWTHSLEAKPTALQVGGPQTGPIIAKYRQNGNLTYIRARSSSLQDVYDEFWATAQAIDHYYPVRVEAPKNAEYSIEWQLPRWGQIVEIAQTHGVLPAGVSRMGSIFTARCQKCNLSVG